MSKRFLLLSPLLSAAGTLLFAACSSSAPPAQTGGDDASVFDATRPVCTAGATSTCVCGSGGFGTTVCSEAGTSFGACMGCPDASAPLDSGVDAAPPAKDASPPVDAGAEGGAAPPAAFVFAHAAPGVPPIRICLAAAASGPANVLPIPPIPDAPAAAPAVPAMGSFPAVAQGTPGIYPGTIRALPFASDFSTVDVTFFAVLSSSVTQDVVLDGGLGIGPDGGGEESCVALVGPLGLGTADSPPGRLQAGTDFVALAPIPAGTLEATGTYLFSLTGCFAGAGAATGTCGGSGTNAAIGVARLDTAAVGASSLGAQFANRSSALEGTPFGGHAAASAGVIPVLVTGGSTITPLASPEVATTFSGTAVAPSSAAALAVDPTSASAAFGVLLQPAGGGIPSTQPYPAGDLFAEPLSTIETLSSWTASTASGASSFASGDSFTFVLVGDPSAPAVGSASYDGRGLHFVAFPNRFTSKSN